MILDGKTILVSGVGPGLGREIASRVLRDGGRVVIGARKAESIAAAAKELDPSGERILAHAFDITDESACAGIVAAAEERFGRLDGLAQVGARIALLARRNSGGRRRRRSGRRLSQ